IVSMGQGARAAIEDEVEGAGTNLIIVSAGVGGVRSRIVHRLLNPEHFHPRNPGVRSRIVHGLRYHPPADGGLR
ncbi:MAG TPA: hypothetical protein VFS23_41850, partial [Vicinamibacterales bacterium]|nr:hypothetical protein [Vicinamibacterales bacterium]